MGRSVWESKNAVRSARLKNSSRFYDAKNKLTNCNGQSISYDASGNPISYYGSKLNKKFTIMFGNKNAWTETKNIYNKASALYFDHYSSVAYDEASNIVTGNPTYGDSSPYFVLNMNIAYVLTFARFAIRTRTPKKIYNAVWGPNGKDPYNRLAGYAFYITGDKKYNGAYAIFARGGYPGLVTLHI